jgi:hypothetical protein
MCRLRRVTGHDAIKKVMEAGAAAPLFPDIPEALRQLNNANIKAGGWAQHRGLQLCMHSA